MVEQEFTSLSSDEIWKKILEILEERLQLGFLEQARQVKKAVITSGELQLHISDKTAFNFFSLEDNQQRLIIQSKPIVKIRSIVVVEDIA